MKFWERFCRLFKKAPEPVSDGDRYTQIVRDYFNAGNHNVVELCDAIGMTPRQLYFAVNDDNVRANILPRLPEKARTELRDELTARAFSRQPVSLFRPTTERHSFINLNELMEHVHLLHRDYQLSNAGKDSVIKAYIHSLTPRTVRIAFSTPNHEFNVGIIEDINVVQQNLLMVNYGKLNPRGNRQSF
ncbi:hypothetical protein pEaSNUABM6_00132 [Erwinia phage pEa_SNUABM_6]|nr:hypothetical protein pEaSNUABM6_00132 [Erwinia phage pEa_SNUABM_6]